MPFVLTYDALLTTVGNYLERYDLNTYIPTFIKLAETKAARIIKNQLATNTVTSTLTASNNLVTKPAGWVEELSFSISVDGSVRLLKKRARETIQVMFPSTTSTGIPKYYAEWQNNYFQIGPIPDDDYPFELLYYVQPAALDANTQTNYLTENCPDLLLYGTLLEAEGYLKNDDRLPVWKAAYDESLSQITGQDMRRQTDRQQDRKKGA